jgi:hypothetical protein
MTMMQSLISSNYYIYDHAASAHIFFHEYRFFIQHGNSFNLTLYTSCEQMDDLFEVTIVSSTKHIRSLSTLNVYPWKKNHVLRPLASSNGSTCFKNPKFVLPKTICVNESFLLSHVPFHSLNETKYRETIPPYKICIGSLTMTKWWTNVKEVWISRIIKVWMHGIGTEANSMWRESTSNFNMKHVYFEAT